MLQINNNIIEFNHILGVADIVVIYTSMFVNSQSKIGLISEPSKIINNILPGLDIDLGTKFIERGTNRFLSREDNNLLFSSFKYGKTKFIGMPVQETNRQQKCIENVIFNSLIELYKYSCLNNGKIYLPTFRQNKDDIFMNAVLSTKFSDNVVYLPELQ